MKNLIAMLIAVMMCCTTAMATENNTKSNEGSRTEQNKTKSSIEQNDVPTCTVSASASYTGTGTCGGSQFTATSVKSASCSGADCQAAFFCASFSAYMSALNDVNSIMELCNN